MPGCRISSSPAPRNSPSQIDRGDTPSIRAATRPCRSVRLSRRCGALRAHRRWPTRSACRRCQSRLELAGEFGVAPARAVRAASSLGRVLPLVFEQGVGQRPQDRLGVLPADRIQRAEGVGDEDGLVADVAEVAAAVAGEEIEQLGAWSRCGPAPRPPRRAASVSQLSIAGGERLERLVRRRQLQSRPPASSASRPP